MIERSCGYRKHKARHSKYRAVIIDGKKIFRFAAFAAALGIISGIIMSSFWGNDRAEPTEPEEVQQETAAEEEPVGVDADKAAASIADRLKKLSVYLLGFDPYTPTGALAAEVHAADLINSYAIISDGESLVPTAAPTPEVTPEPEPDTADSSDIKAIDAAQNSRYDDYQIRVGNQTSYGVDINAMLSEPLNIDMSGEGPKILIVHTHATEAYAEEGAQRYNREESDRSMEVSENVVAVGDEAARIFNERGIETLHDTALHDYPSFNGSYADALSSTEQYLNDYPGIQIVFDIHRDSVVYDDGTKAKTVTEINGKKAAQLMFVVGTDENGLYHPNWRENMKFAVQLQDRIDRKYPNLMRYINLRKNRFNGHTTKGSLIIEVGTSGNSLSEAKYGISLAAECIAEFLNELK